MRSLRDPNDGVSVLPWHAVAGGFLKLSALTVQLSEKQLFGCFAPERCVAVSL